MARGRAAERRRRRAPGGAAYRRGGPTVIDCDQGEGEAALARDNRGRVGGQPAAGTALVAALAALREASGMPCRGLHGHLGKLTGWKCTLSASRSCGRTSARPTGAFSGGLRAGGYEAGIRRRGGATVIGVRRARGPRGAGQRMTITHLGGMAVICAGPGRRPGQGAVTGTTFLSTGNRSAGRIEKRGHGAGRRDNHKFTACTGTGTGRMLVGVVTGDRTGDGTAPVPRMGALRESGALRGKNGERPPVHAYGAHGSRKSLGAARALGTGLVAPININDSGRSCGTSGWHEEAAWRPAGIRDARRARGADIGKISRKKRAANRESWKADAGQSIRSRVEAVFSAFKRVFGGHVTARKWENVVTDVARKIAIYNALLEAAGEA